MSEEMKAEEVTARPLQVGIVGLELEVEMLAKNPLKGLVDREWPQERLVKSPLQGLLG